MAAALLLIFNDPTDRLLPVPAPVLRAGPDTTWDAAVTVGADGAVDWEKALAARRSARPGAAGDAWPQLAAALPAAAVGQPAATQSAADHAAALALLDRTPAEAVFAIPDGDPADGPEELVRVARLLDAALAADGDPEGQVARLARLAACGAGAEDLDGLLLAATAEARAHAALLGLAAAGGVDAVRRLRPQVRVPPAPQALRRLRLRLLAASQRALPRVMARMDRAVAANIQPDINVLMGLINRACDQLGAVLPEDPAQAHAVATVRLPALADLAPEPVRRTLAERMLFTPPVRERATASAAMIARRMLGRLDDELARWQAAAGRAAGLAAVLDAWLALPEPRPAGAAALAGVLRAALPPGTVSVTISATSSSVDILVRDQGVLARIATFPTDQP